MDRDNSTTLIVISTAVKEYPHYGGEKGPLQWGSIPIIVGKVNKKACRNESAGFFSSASGDRTRVSAVRGRRPRPLDECTVSCHSFHCLTLQN